MPIESLGTPVRSTPQTQRLREPAAPEPERRERESAANTTETASETASAPASRDTGTLTSLRGNVVDFYA